MLIEAHLIKVNINKLIAHFLDGKRVKLLNVSVNEIHTIEKSAFDGMINIRILSLISNAITNLQWHLFSKLEYLEYLYTRF